MICWEENKGLEQLPEICLANSALQGLHLSDNKLTELDERLFESTALVSLKLSSNEIKTLSPSVAQLQELERLVLSYNAIGKLPSLADLGKLKVLQAADNRLVALPDLPSALEEIDLSHNRIRNLGDMLHGLRKLRRLDLSHNRIRKMPGFGGLASLENLTLSSNPLAELPEGVWDLPQLRYLVCYECPVERLVVEAGVAAASLQEFVVTYSKLSSIPSEICEFTNLRILQLNEAPIQEIPAEIGRLQDLEILSFSFNQIREVPESFYDLTRVQRVNLAGNPLPKKTKDRLYAWAEEFGVVLYL